MALSRVGGGGLKGNIVAEREQRRLAVNKRARVLCVVCDTQEGRFWSFRGGDSKVFSVLIQRPAVFSD